MTDAELASAWLDGDLDEVAAAAFARRLRDEPELRAVADGLEQAKARLRRYDAVALPDGLAARMAAAIDTERAAPDPTSAPQPERDELAAARARRGRRMTTALGSVAAVVLLAAVVATGAVLGPLAGGDDTAEVADDPDVATMQADPDAAPQRSGGVQSLDGDETEAGDATGQPFRSPTPEADGDALTDVPADDGEMDDDATASVSASGATTDDPDAVRDLYGDGGPAAIGLLGVEVSVAADVEAGFDAQLADLDAGGTPADACVDEVRNTFAGPAVVVGVDAATTDGVAVLNHTVVTAGDESPVFDRISVVGTDAASCAIVASVPLDGR